MTPEEYRDWERAMFEGIPMIQFVNVDNIDPKDSWTRDLPLPKWPRLKAQDKNWLKSCGIKG